MEYQFSEGMKHLKPSVIREILKDKNKPGVISLGAGDPAPESLPVVAIQEMTARVLERQPMDALLYSQSEGYPPLREAVSKLMETRYQIDMQVNDVLITSGAQQAMDLATKILCNPGDVIICEDPSFIGSLNAFRAYDVELVGVPMESDGIHIGKLEEALQNNPKAKLIYLIPNFQNPTGITMSWEKRKAVYALAKKYSVLILEDNPYGELRFDGEDIPAIKTLDQEGLVIYAGTFSKVLSSGLRVGYAVTPKPISGKMAVAKQCADVHTSMLPQLICHEFLQTMDFSAHVDTLKAVYNEKAHLMMDIIDREFPKEVKYNVPEGGLFILCELPKGMSGTTFAKTLSEKSQVLVVPGQAFMIDPDEDSPSFRMSFSMPSKEDIVNGVTKAGALLRELF